MRVLLTIFTILTGILISHAYRPNERTPDFDNNRIAFSGIFTTSHSWQVDASYHYMINPYLGFGASIGSWEVFDPDGYPKGLDWRVEADCYKPWNLFLRPSVILKTPCVRLKNCKIGLLAQPGFMMNIPYARVSILQRSANTEYTRKNVSTSSGQWLAFDVRTGPFVNVGPCCFSAGYLFSNHDIYGQFRQLKYNGESFDKFYPKKRSLQGLYLLASYCF